MNDPANKDSPIKAVAFDLDGLMVNTEELYNEVCDAMLKRRSKQATPELLSAMMGRTNVDALQVLIDWHDLGATPQELLVENDELLYALVEERLEAMPGVLNLLDALEQHSVRKAITTSGRAAYVEKVVEQLGIADRFEFRLTAESITNGKPHPEIYRLAADKFGIANADMAVLEDSDVGCRAGVAAGSVVVAVPSPLNKNMPFHGAAIVVESLEDPAALALLGVA